MQTQQKCWWWMSKSYVSVLCLWSSSLFIHFTHLSFFLNCLVVVDKTVEKREGCWTNKREKNGKGKYGQSKKELWELQDWHFTSACHPHRRDWLFSINILFVFVCKTGSERNYYRTNTLTHILNVPKRNVVSCFLLLGRNLSTNERFVVMEGTNLSQVQVICLVV